MVIQPLFHSLWKLNGRRDPPGALPQPVLPWLQVSSVLYCLYLHSCGHSPNPGYSDIRAVLLTMFGRKIGYSASWNELFGLLGHLLRFKRKYCTALPLLSGCRTWSASSYMTSNNNDGKERALFRLQGVWSPLVKNNIPRLCAIFDLQNDSIISTIFLFLHWCCTGGMFSQCSLNVENYTSNHWFAFYDFIESEEQGSNLRVMAFQSFHNFSFLYNFHGDKLLCLHWKNIFLFWIVLKTPLNIILLKAYSSYMSVRNSVFSQRVSSKTKDSIYTYID